MTFSFLYRNERTATFISPQQRIRANASILSVSSIGTNELQRISSNSPMRPVPSFSFLYRNERTATKRGVMALGLILIAFSFLYRNERTATMIGLPSNPNMCSFQFPLSERTNCNRAILRFGAVADSTFSFLYRNERTATMRLLHAGARLALSFSFLYRNERTATLGRSGSGVR